MSVLQWVYEIVDGVNSTLVGLRTTGRFLWENVTDKEGGATALTHDYPVQPAQIPDGYRGHLFNDVDKCTLCKSCSRACPIDCISMEGELNENAKFHISRYDIDLSKCIYCGLCTQVCPTDCLTMTKGFAINPSNEVNDRGSRYLFRMRADQTRVRLTTEDMDRWHTLNATAPELWTESDRQFLSQVQDAEKGQFLFGRYGKGFYTPEEKSRVDTLRAERKKAREAAAALAAEKANAAASEANKS